MARLELIGAFALTEPDRGSDAVTVEGTDVVHALIVGRAITGLSAVS